MPASLILTALVSAATYQSYVDSGEFYESEARQSQTVEAYPCAYYGGARAPLGTDSRLCGLSWREGDLTVRHRGAEAFIGSDLTIRASQHAYDRGEFWVMRKDTYALAGIRRDQSQNAVMISLDEGEWRSTRINCGEYGFYHAFPMSTVRHHTVVAYASEGQYLFCRLNFLTHEQTQSWVEAPNPTLPLQELRIAWGEDGAYQIRSRNGDVIFRSGDAE